MDAKRRWPDLGERFELVRELGSGATATVYLAHDRKHDRSVAIKVLRPELAASLAHERFLREIAIAARLQHPHILPLIDSGEAAGSLYFVMPFVEGETLRERLRRHGAERPDAVIRILADVADALVYAHGRGIVHRDIKPDNVILSGRHAVVMDFGVAKAMSAAIAAERPLTVGLALGTPAYMAPEQATADPAADHRVDVYALGVLGYELLAGRPPFVTDGPQATLLAQIGATPAPIASLVPDLPPGLAELVMRCLAKDPAARWQRAADLVDRLDPRATPDATTPIATPAKRRRWAPWLALAIGVGGIGFASADLLRRGGPAPALEATPTRLTFSGDLIESAISPDGLLLATVTAPDGANRLSVLDLAGSAAVALDSSAMIVGVGWSADGTELSYWDANGLAVIGRLGGARRPLGSASGYRSPDGRRLALLAAPATEIAIVTVATGDTARAQPPSGFRWYTGFAWSAGGDRFVAAIGSTEERRAGLAIGAGGGPMTLVLADSVAIVAPVWDPTGRAIYYLRSRNGDADLARVEVDDHGQARGAPSVVATGLAVSEIGRRSPAFSPLSITRDGRRIEYTRTDHWSNVGRLALDRMDAKSTPEVLTMGTASYTSPHLSPDRTQMAVFRSAARGSVLAVASADGTGLRELVPVEEGLDLVWAPDGSAIGFTALRADHALALGIHDLRSGATRYLAAGQIGATLDWSVAGIVVQAAGSRGLLRIDPGTGAIDPAPIDVARYAFDPALAPDGRRVAYYTGYRAGPTMGLVIRDLGTAAERTLARGEIRALRWSADGRGIYTVRSVPGGSARLELLPADGSPVRISHLIPAGFTVEDVTLDGRVATVNQVRVQSDAWALDLAPRRPAPR